MRRRSVVPAVALLLLSRGVSQSPAAPARRLPPPDRPAVGEALALIRSGFAEEYEALRSSTTASAFCRRLLVLAEATGDDAAAKFALCEEAARIAREHRDIGTAFDALEGLASTFEVDGLDLRWQVLRAFARDAAAADQQIDPAEAQFLCLLLDEAISADRFTIAEAFTDRLSALLPYLKSAAKAFAQARVAALAAARSQHVEIDAVLEQLAAGRPVPVEERRRAAEYWCFVKEDWERGLPLLANSGSSAVASAAGNALAERTEATTLAEADAWWSLAEAASDRNRGSMLRRAIKLYRTVLPALSGLDRLRVEQRLTSRRSFADALAAEARQYFDHGWTRLGEKALSDLQLLDPDLATAIQTERGLEKR